MTFNANSGVRLLAAIFRYYIPVILAAAGIWFAVSLRPPFLWGILALTLLIVAFAADNVVGDSVRETNPTLRSRWRFWILPASFVAGTTMFLYRVVDPAFLGVGVFVALVALSLGLYAEASGARTNDPNVTTAHLFLSLVTYLAAFFLFVSLFDANQPILLRAAVIGATALVLTLELCRQSRADFRSSVPHAIVAAVLLSQATLALDFWPVAGLGGGVFLLLVFYAVSGIGQSYFAGRLRRATVLEFLAIMILGLVLLFASRAWIL